MSRGRSVATSTYYIHTDHLGGTNVVTNSAGTAVEVTDYYPFGSQRIHTGSFTEQRKFIGQEYDEEADLTYLQARYYDQDTGKFTSQDPVFWEIGQTPDGKSVLQNPQAQNSYSYAGNNPITSKDPTGRLWWSEFYTDWNGYDVTCVCRDNGLILKAGEVLGGRSAALSAISRNAGNIEAASKRTGVSPDVIKAIIYEEQSHQFPPFGGEALAERIAPNAVKGGIGVMQVSANTSGLSNELLLDPRRNINAGAAILQNLQGNYGGYNSQSGGPHAERYGSRVDSYVGSQTYISNMSRIVSGLSKAVSQLSKLLKKK